MLIEISNVPHLMVLILLGEGGGKKEGEGIEF